MAIYPGARVRLLPRAFARATVRNRVTFHTAVTNADSLYAQFAKGGAASHFYVGEDGTVEQYIDTDRFSAADLEGNDEVSADHMAESLSYRLDLRGEPAARAI